MTELVLKEVSEEESVDINWSDIMGNIAIGKISLWLKKRYTPDNVLVDKNS